jgi:hypothetical protein
MVRMLARLCSLLVCLSVAFLGGCGGGSQATIPPDATVATGGSGGTGGQSATATSTAPAVCVPGASVACACVTGQQGAQTCTSAGTFAACVCSAPDSGAPVVPADALVVPVCTLPVCAHCGTVMNSCGSVDCGTCPDAGSVPDVQPVTPDAGAPDTWPATPDACAVQVTTTTVSGPVTALAWTETWNGPQDGVGITWVALEAPRYPIVRTLVANLRGEHPEQFEIEVDAVTYFNLPDDGGMRPSSLGLVGNSPLRVILRSSQTQLGTYSAELVLAYLGKVGDTLATECTPLTIALTGTRTQLDPRCSPACPAE